ncbi:hypothetical protein CIG75_07355 [Tumebacillus algifaecis]|uniref:PH domain-containing protein n=1 Tax=Tumebacillus algifaecis TaxID=1214604 RepID=A0A223CZN9_9BACL|nr:hypothetical protein [Tumebacillus algifaecis]ASS74812.1 hypothetical protein CIG75_07355 [Tumebacillus algifaecis]
MLYRYENKMGWLLIVLTLPALYMIFVQETWKEAVILVLLYLLLLVLVFMRHFLQKGLRVTDEGLVVERRLLAPIVYPWEGLRVKYHPKEKRLAAGLELAQGEGGPRFLALTNVRDEDKLRAELEHRLGSRYSDGASHL